MKKARFLVVSSVELGPGFVKPEDWSAQRIGQPEEVRPDIDLSGAGWIAAPEEKETDSICA